MKNKRNIKNEIKKQQRKEAFQRKLDEISANQDIPESNSKVNDNEESLVNAQIASEVKKILAEKKKEEHRTVKNGKNVSKQSQKKKISKPKIEPEYFELRYTMPKERGIIARIINQIKYEKGWYEDIEDYLDDEENFVWDDMEWSKNAQRRRDQRLYKRVQAYEDADNDIAMKKAFLTVKIATVVAMLAVLGFSVNFLYNEVHDLIHNSTYVTQAQEKSTLANANAGEIAHAERVLTKIDYNFEHLTYNELLDTIIRIGGKPSEITESRAMGTIKNAGDFADQKLLEEIVQDAYEDEYDGFDNKKKQELNQLIYEMLDDEIKIWIRSPEDVAKLKEKNGMYTLETDEAGSER